MSVNMGEVFWLKLPGDSNEGVLKSVKVPEGGTDASIIRSFGEIVPGGPSEEKSFARPRSVKRGEAMVAEKSAEGRPKRSTSCALMGLAICSLGYGGMCGKLPSMKLGVDMTRLYVCVLFGWFC